MYSCDIAFENMNNLKTITIGSNSFTESKNSYGQKNKSFICANNPVLTTMTFGMYSFSDYNNLILEGIL